MQDLKKKIVEILSGYAVDEWSSTGTTGYKIIYCDYKQMNDIADDLCAALKKDTAARVLYVTDKPIGELLEMFWQRSSDACPLECGEAENQESAFKEWAESISQVIRVDD